MGHSEAIYRAIASLHLKESNLGTKFIPAGFPANRSKYLQAVHEDNKNQHFGRKLIEIEGKEGKFVEKPTLLSKYERRPKYNAKDKHNLTKKELETKALLYLTYAQFVKEYDPVKNLKRKKKKVVKKEVGSDDDDSDEDQNSSEDSSSDEDDDSEMFENIDLKLDCEIELEESDLEDQEEDNSENGNRKPEIPCQVELYYSSDMCQQTFSRQWDMKKHMRAEHGYCDACEEMYKEQHFHCDICDEILDFQEDLKMAKSTFYKHKKQHKLVLPKRKYAPGKSLTLPKHFKLEPCYPGEPKYMKLRSYPAAMRRHKIKQRNHEYFYSELILYSPFYDESVEMKPYLENDEACLDAYLNKSKEEGKSDVQIAKSKIMPHLESVTEGRARAEEAQENLNDIGDKIDPAKEQENIDADDEGITQDPDHLVLEPGELLSEGNVDTTKDKFYRRIELGNLDELAERTRKLDPEQRQVVDIGIKYAKDLVKSLSGNCEPPEPPLLIIQGGAGSGKSTVIGVLTDWMEHFLRKSADDPNHPYIIKAAYTGSAAVIISGQTLHSAFKMPFGNKFERFSNEERDRRRIILQNLKVVIIDEISFVKADLLYQLHLRLQEIKCNTKLFGGVAMFFFGKF